MNAHDVLQYGHQTVLQTIADFPEAGLYTEGACGLWSVKDILAHLTSFEEVLVDILTGYTGTPSPTPALDAYIGLGPAFNDGAIAQRAERTFAEVVAELETHHAQVMTLAQQIPPEVYRQVGTAPWYGSAYALDDIIVYMYYGHKREHSAQIQRMRERLNP